MKNFMIGTAMVLVYMIILTLSFDSKMYLEEINELKFISKEISATGSLFLDYQDFAMGSITFNDTESMKAIDDQIKVFMGLKDDDTPLETSYWQEPTVYMIYFYDDTGICRVYQNDTFYRQFNFTYPYLHEDELGEFKKTVTEPTIITTINAGKPRSRLTFFQDFMNDLKVIKSSAYNWSEYN